MGSMNSISDVSALGDFDHQEFFIIEEFNQRYLKKFNQNEVNGFYESFDFSKYLQHKKAENEIVINLLKMIHKDWLFQSFKIMLLIKKTFFTFYYFDVCFTQNINDYQECLKIEEPQKCMEKLNTLQFTLYETQRNKMAFMN